MSEQKVAMVHLTIDGRPVAVPKGTTVWQAARGIGIEIPIFCYHDRMPPLGACRMCLVEIEKMPKLVTACTQEAGEDMVVRTQSERVRQGQQGILEFLLVNHPLDCPICDKGGECPLQDNTLKFGPGQSRFIETKRMFRKHIRMGPVLVLDRERCILCWRCVRFGEILAGDDALKGFERGYHSQIGTPFTEPVNSKFIGNTIEICPVGALTSATYRFRARPWDNRQSQSVCPHCGCGCAMQLNVRGNDLVRTRPREHPEVNDIWLCDKGFFGYEFVTSAERLTAPLVRRDGVLREATWEDALDRVAQALRAAPPERIGVMGGTRTTNEDNYLLLRLFRGIVGTNHIDFRIETAHPQPAARAPWGLDGSIADVERADAIVLAGCDLTEEYPIIWLRVKKAIDRGVPLIIVNPWALEIARWARHSLVHRWGAEGLLLDALAGLVAPEAAAGAAQVPADQIRAAAAAVAGARRPLVLVGRTALERPDGLEILDAVDRLRAACGGAGLGLLRGRGNSGGAQALGLLPDMLPGYRPLSDAAARSAVESVWGRRVPTIPGQTVRGMCEAARAERLEALYVVGADPATDYPDAGAWAEARRRIGFLAVHELFLTRTAASADVVLPVLSFAEKTGTVCNIEGRIQRQDQARLGPGLARPDSFIFSQIASRLGTTLASASWEDVFAEIARVIPGWGEGARLAAPRPPLEVRPAPGAAAGPAGPAVPSVAPRDPEDGTLTLLTGTRLFNRGQMALRCPGVRNQAGEPFVALHPADASRLGVSDGAACEVRSPRGALRLAARIWPGLRPGQAYVPRGYDAAPVNTLEDEQGPVAVTVRALVAAAAAG